MTFISCFSNDYMEVVYFGQRPQKLCHSNYISRVSIISMTVTFDIDFNLLTEVYLSNFSSIESLFPPLSILYSLEGSYYAEPTLMELSGMLQHLEDEVYSYVNLEFL